jgi:hypothetical protein
MFSRPIAALVVGLTLASTVHAATYVYSGPDDGDFPGVKYQITVTDLGSNKYSVGVTISKTTLTSSAWLDEFSLKVSSGLSASVSNVTKPSGWSQDTWDAFFVRFKSQNPGNYDFTDIDIYSSSVSFSYELTTGSLILPPNKWSIKATYLTEKPNKPGKYNQTGVSFEVTPQFQPEGGVIPEPATLILFGMGLVAPLAARWRKR